METKEHAKIHAGGRRQRALSVNRKKYNPTAYIHTNAFNQRTARPAPNRTVTSNAYCHINKNTIPNTNTNTNAPPVGADRANSPRSGRLAANFQSNSQSHSKSELPGFYQH